MEPSSGQLQGVLSNISKSKFYDKEKLLPKPGDEPGPSGASTSAPEPPPSYSGGFAPLLVNPRQKGNPLLKHVTNVAWQFDESIVADYQTSRTAGVLFLSLRYHNLNPEYIHDRIKLLGKNYDLRVLLVQIDFPNCEPVLKGLNKICLLAQLTLMLAWSAEEAGKIVETYKRFENKPADMIMEKSDEDPYYQVVKVLCSVPTVNRADAITLLSVFGSFEKIVKAPIEKLELCPGIGPSKAENLFKALHRPFLRQGVSQAEAEKADENEQMSGDDEEDLHSD